MEKVDKLLFEGIEWGFITEIMGRSIVMFLLVLLVLRLSGKRGVRQLTLFEVAIILSLGSAAGDPMFQEDIPVFYGAVVLFTVILLYKMIAWAASEFKLFNRIMEGVSQVIVRDGQFVVQSNGRLGFSQREFYAEMRNQSVEHLGQLRVGVLENDGTLSLLFYSSADVRPGLPIFPDHYKKVEEMESGIDYACMYCGWVDHPEEADRQCPRCERREWAIASHSKRI